MDPALLQRILQCPSLPSLPMVAARVIELTGDPNVKFEDLAKVIQQDQGLASKILKTVNSSFYGLRQRCSTIQKAIVLLGLSPVKTLALGFSLVSELEMKDPDRFDHTGYWRRSLYTATAGKLLADACGLGEQANEAFLGGLLQDIGMMAMHRALGEEYLQVIDRTNGDHRTLVKYELEHLEAQHPDVGAMLASRWRLPPELVLPIKYHERPTASPPDHTATVRCVGLGNVIHDVLTDADPTPALDRLYKRADAWFRIKPTRIDELLTACQSAIRELGAIFKLDTGDEPDTAAILDRAEARRSELAAADPGAAAVADAFSSIVIDPEHTDPMTGLFTRGGFDDMLGSAFTLAKAKGGAVATVVIAIDGQVEKYSSQRPEVSDSLSKAIALQLSKSFRGVGGVAARLGTDLYAVVADCGDRVALTRATEALRKSIREASTRISAEFGFEGGCTASVGIALADFAKPPSINSAPQLLAAAMRATQASRGSGGDTTRIFAQKLAA